MFSKTRTFMTAVAAFATVGTAALVCTTTAEAHGMIGFSHYSGGYSSPKFYQSNNKQVSHLKPTYNNKLPINHVAPLIPPSKGCVPHCLAKAPIMPIQPGGGGGGPAPGPGPGPAVGPGPGPAVGPGLPIDPSQVASIGPDAAYATYAAANPASTRTASTAPANSNNCLTKEYSSNGQVLFRDVCTGEMAMAPVNSAAEPIVQTAPSTAHQLGQQPQDPAL
jgi:hypothetical protein